MVWSFKKKMEEMLEKKVKAIRVSTESLSANIKSGVHAKLFTMSKLYAAYEMSIRPVYQEFYNRREIIPGVYFR